VVQVNKDDDHNFEGLLVRDMMRLYDGMPDFDAKRL
jgi:hypothetical protein